MKRREISAQQIDELLQGKAICRRGRDGDPKVALNSDEVVKIYYLKRKSFFRRNINTAAGNFVANAKCLAELQITTVKVTGWYRCKERCCDVVIYQALPGKTLYEFKHDDMNEQLLQKLAQFIAALHKKGIYFRAGHGDNYLCLPDGRFALIDIDNLRFSIGLRRVAKNLSYLYKHAADNNFDYLMRYGYERFLEDYFFAAHVSLYKKWLIAHLVRYYLNQSVS